MAHESTGRDWFEMLGALPFPVAVLDADYRFLLLNRASATDPLLGRSRVGSTDLGCCEDEPAALARARERHRQYERSLSAQEPLFFEEESPAAEDGRRLLWICIPVRLAGNARLLVAGVRAGLADVDQTESEPILQLLHKINRELRAPLAAMVGLAGTLARELSGGQQARASLIDESGQRLLKHLSLLMEEARQSPRHRVNF